MACDVLVFPATFLSISIDYQVISVFLLIDLCEVFYIPFITICTNAIIKLYALLSPSNIDTHQPEGSLSLPLSYNNYSKGSELLHDHFILGGPTLSLMPLPTASLSEALLLANAAAPEFKSRHAIWAAVHQKEQGHRSTALPPEECV